MTVNDAYNIFALIIAHLKFVDCALNFTSSLLPMPALLRDKP